jgi:hypothetical protein
MIVDIIIVVALGAVAVFFWTEIVRLQTNIDLLNNYAFSSFERIIAIEQLIIDDAPQEDDDDEA